MIDTCLWADYNCGCMAREKPKTYSVSEITSLIKVALEQKLPSRMIVVGEISDWKHHASGHCYFSLKDENGQLPCVMWASKFKNTKFTPENGMEVLATGHIDVYPPGGKYQLYVDKLQPGGTGALQLAFEQMVTRLKAEGLFKDEHKKPIPPWPMRIGIVTSESSAALIDIADSIFNRWPCARMLLYHAPVQGDSAAAAIATAIRNINKRNSDLKLDVLIVGRGGGSLEDLWPFNEEVLARAIFDSKIPIISAVGHEIDVTIADLVADARASTPTKAGVIAVPDINEILERIAVNRKRLDLAIKRSLELYAQNLATVRASSVFKNPRWMIGNSAQRLDDITTRLSDSARVLFESLHRRIRYAHQQILRIEPHRLVGQKKMTLSDIANTADAAIKNILMKNKLKLTAAENRLAVLDPRSVLTRGYSITTNKKTGKVITASSDVEIGDLLITELAEKNLIESQVKKK